MPITVRLATSLDAESIHHLTEAAFAPLRSIYLPNSAALTNLAALTPSLHRLVAEESSQLLGTLRYTPLDNTLRIIGLAVHPHSRRRGVARTLISSLLPIAREHHCTSLSLYTITQTGNIPIFQYLGFHLISELPAEYSLSPTGDSLTEAYMQRPIPSQ
ncbi:MAG TPA: GNAT family N-acetyltransferase [Tepidisphaeraceae bacterium]|nr:GNAT family N-acetyltransferase [Tepidisphaeraceae bacterium]